MEKPKSQRHLAGMGNEVDRLPTILPPRDSLARATVGKLKSTITKLKDNDKCQVKRLHCYALVLSVARYCSFLLLIGISLDSPVGARAADQTSLKLLGSISLVLATLESIPYNLYDVCKHGIVDQQLCMLHCPDIGIKDPMVRL